jgi:dihydrofolate reductase
MDSFSLGIFWDSLEKWTPARNVRPNIVSRLPEKSASPAEMISMLNQYEAGADASSDGNDCRIFGGNSYYQHFPESQSTTRVITV